MQHPNLRIVVEGCCHGELDQIYASIARMEQEKGQKMDLLICCGDFQAVRNKEDLKAMNVPSKYLTMASFHRYYSGEAIAPVLTLFVGGNHEASNHLQELYYGGWVAPNIYYLGCSGVVSVGGVRIAGISGIYNGRDYRRGHFETPPYSPSTLRSIYHVREYEVFKLAQLAVGTSNDGTGSAAPVDVMLSHDWPRGIYHHGNLPQLLRTKPYFRQECETNTLGSEAGELLLQQLQPSFWFAGHLHCKFAAVVRHPHQLQQQQQQRMTKFLALDKCLPNRDFLQLVEVPRPRDNWETPVRLEYDLEWLAILRSTHSLLSRAEREVVLPQESRMVSGADKDWVRQRLTAACQARGQDPAKHALEIPPSSFVRTAAVYSPSHPAAAAGDGTLRGSPQTDALLKLLELSHRVTIPYTHTPPLPHLSMRGQQQQQQESQQQQQQQEESQQQEEEQKQPRGGDSLFFLDRGEKGRDPNSIELDDEDGGDAAGEEEEEECDDEVAMRYKAQQQQQPQGKSENKEEEDVIVFRSGRSPPVAATVPATAATTATAAAAAAPQAGTASSPALPFRRKLVLPPPSASSS